MNALTSGICTVFCLALGLTGAFGQTQDSYEYQTEFVWGINKNTSGGLIGGFILKGARKRSDRLLETFGLEIMNVKHPQELRTNSYYTGNFFIFGKSNYLYALRLQYGRDLILFKKAPHQGVEVKAVAALGPSLGIVAPYYVEYSLDNSSFITLRSQYNLNIPVDAIWGTGRLFEGLGESRLVPGANLKAGLNFEMGDIKSSVAGFEAGFLIDAYTRKIEMIPRAKQYSVYPTLYITIFYGTRK
ncbi:MAG: hypothetical protein KatS3mg032_0843 [Cyclobacteriaceae bacterium]|nr:MAG: hypothetical protein KatS3mg032_0843 [Cyclobacteriaceae bacterium]